MKIYEVTVDGVTYEVSVEEIFRSGIQHRRTQEQTCVNPLNSSKEKVAVSDRAEDHEQVSRRGNISESKMADTEVSAPIQGSIYKIIAAEGKHLRAGDTILILEAMKLENEIVAPRDGTVRHIYVKEGDAVDTGDLLIDFSSEA